MFVLDTNVVSELRKLGDGKADANVVAWISSVDAATLYLSAISLMELELGVLLAEKRQSPAASLLRTWMDSVVLPEFAERILPVDKDVALRCATLHVSTTRPHADALIAATALVHGMSLVTRNVSDFDPMHVPLINPWDRSS